MPTKKKPNGIRDKAPKTTNSRNKKSPTTSLSKATSKKKPISATSNENIVVTLTDEEKLQVEVISDAVSKQKIALADLLRVFEENKNQLIESITRVEQVLFDQIKMIARAHGVDPDYGGWSFDADTGEFTKKRG